MAGEYFYDAQFIVIIIVIVIHFTLWTHCVSSVYSAAFMATFAWRGCPPEGHLFVYIHGVVNYVLWVFVQSWPTVLCCAVVCCAVVCCAVLCCAVLLCAVLCQTVLCCAVAFRQATLMHS